MEQSKPCTYSANRISTLSLSRKGEASGERSFGHRLLDMIHKLLSGCAKLDMRQKMFACCSFSCFFFLVSPGRCCWLLCYGSVEVRLLAEESELGLRLISGDIMVQYASRELHVNYTCTRDENLTRRRAITLQDLYMLVDESAAGEAWSSQASSQPHFSQP
jgi:hypothetical protein